MSEKKFEKVTNTKEATMTDVIKEAFIKGINPRSVLDNNKNLKIEFDLDQILKDFKENNLLSIMQVVVEIKEDEVYLSLSKNIKVSKKDNKIVIVNPFNESLEYALFQKEVKEYKLFSLELYNLIKNDEKCKFKVKLINELKNYKYPILTNKELTLPEILTNMYLCSLSSKEYNTFVQNVRLIKA